MAIFEVLILFMLIVIAVVSNIVLKQKRAARQTQLEREFEQQEQARQTSRALARQKRAQAEKAIQEEPTYTTHIPQDSTLKRHYLSHLQAMLCFIHSPRPTDCVLGRHHDSLINSELQQCMLDEEQVEKLRTQCQNLQKHLAKPVAQAEHVKLIEPVLKPLISPEVTQIRAKKPSIPEDATLKRHFVTHLRAIIESSKQAKPTDCTLQRHYHSMVDSELQKQLDTLTT